METTSKLGHSSVAGPIVADIFTVRLEVTPTHSRWIFPVAVRERFLPVH